MPKSIMFATDPREITLHPLRMRKRELIAKQSALAEEGLELSDEDRVELKRIVADTATALAATYLTECHGGDCHEMIDVRQHSHVLMHCNSICIYDAETQQVSWVYPPNIGTAVMCIDCYNYATTRFAEQRVEIEEIT